MKKLELVLRYGDAEVARPISSGDILGMAQYIGDHMSPEEVKKELLTLFSQEVLYEVVGMEGWFQLLRLDNPIADEGSLVIRELIRSLLEKVLNAGTH